MTPPVAQTRRAVASGRSRAASAYVPRRGRSRTKPRVHRRVSGAARVDPRRAPPQRTRVQLRPLPVLGTIGSHAFRAGKSLHDSSLLDRLLRGRGWIGLLGVLLIGLVALNVSLLKLNAGAGRNAERARALRIENADLRARVARLGSSERLQAAGSKLGLVMPAPGSVRYLRSRPSVDGQLAARRIELGPQLTPVSLAPTAPPDTTAGITPAQPPATGQAGTPGTNLPAQQSPTASAPQQIAPTAASPRAPAQPQSQGVGGVPQGTGGTAVAGGAAAPGTR